MLALDSTTDSAEGSQKGLVVLVTGVPDSCWSMLLLFQAGKQTASSSRCHFEQLHTESVQGEAFKGIPSVLSPLVPFVVFVFGRLDMIYDLTKHVSFGSFLGHMWLATGTLCR